MPSCLQLDEMTNQMNNNMLVAALLLTISLPMQFEPGMLTQRGQTGALGLAIPTHFLY